MNRLPRNKSLLPRTGQSLIEVLIGVTVAGALILAAGRVVDITTKTSGANQKKQTAAFLAQQLLENIVTYADTQWYCAPTTCAATRGVYNLTKGSSQRYYLVATPTLEWRDGASSGEAVVIGATTYNRYFYIENVCRDASGNFITCVGSPPPEDFSTQKATVVVAWSDGGQALQTTMERYLLRTRVAAVSQTDWSGGSWSPNCFSLANNTFAESEVKFGCQSTINFSTPGSFKILGY